ncbi:MAG: ABC transporter permease subunit [Spirochaetaceae bacterium]|nr:MAG: ABC transporter permease subunit [Spirochaetaceae bacterium]
MRRAVNTRPATGDRPSAAWFARRRRPAEAVITAALATAAGASALILVGISVWLGYQTIVFMIRAGVTVRAIVLSARWLPESGHYGMLAFVVATVLTSGIGLAFALPVGIATGTYLEEFASLRVRSTVGPVLVAASHVPTVVFGYFALTALTPALRAVFGDGVGVYNAASAGLAIGFALVPYVAARTQAAVAAVPVGLRAAGLSLGATTTENATRLILPASRYRLAALCLSAFGRAFSETMIVAMAAGIGPRLTINPFSPVETIAGHVLRAGAGSPAASIDERGVFAVATLLFATTVAISAFSRALTRTDERGRT